MLRRGKNVTDHSPIFVVLSMVGACLGGDTLKLLGDNTLDRFVGEYRIDDPSLVFDFAHGSLGKIWFQQ